MTGEGIGQVIHDELAAKPSTFKEQWEAERLMKRTMKKAKRALQKQGFGRRESAKSVNRALGRISRSV